MIYAYMIAIQNVFMPQVYKRMFDLDERGGESIGKYLTPFAYVCIFPALLVSLFSKEFISILTPPSFHGAINIITVLAMYYGFLFFGILAGNQLIFMKKTHVTSVLTMVSIGINVGLNIPFIMRWGAIGAAWATLLAGLISGAIYFFVAQHYYRIEWEYRKVGTIFFVFFSSAIGMILLRHYMVDYSVRLMIKVVILSGYFYFGNRIGIVNRQNFQILLNIFRVKKVTVNK